MTRHIFSNRAPLRILLGSSWKNISRIDRLGHEMFFGKQILKIRLNSVISLEIFIDVCYYLWSALNECLYPYYFNEIKYVLKLSLSVNIVYYFTKMHIYYITALKEKFKKWLGQQLALISRKPSIRHEKWDIDFNVKII